MEENSDQSQKETELYTEEKQYRRKLTATIYSLQDQLEEYQVQSEQRHNELTSKYQRQIEQTKAAEAQSKSLELEVTALRQDRNAESKLIEKLKQQLRVPELARKQDSESISADGPRSVIAQPLQHQNLQPLPPDAEIAANPPFQSRMRVGKLHSSNRPFRCTQCDSAFQQKADLNKHIRMVHKKVVNYRCSHCSKGFYSKSHLTRHLRVHTGGRPFQCKVRSKAFNTVVFLLKIDKIYFH